MEAVAPTLNGIAQIVYGNQNWSTGIMGTTPEHAQRQGLGRSWRGGFTEQDVRTATKVCLLGQTVVENLFGDEDPVGQVVRIKNVPFTVIGVLAAKGQSLGGRTRTTSSMVPVTTAQKKLFGTAFPGMVRTIMVKARSRRICRKRRPQVTDLLEQRHHIGPEPGKRFYGQEPHPDAADGRAVHEGHDPAPGRHRLGLASSWAASAS